MNTNEELTAKQIARIERIRKERKEKLRKMNACSWCCNKTPEDQLIATVDGKYICVPCVEDYNEDHKDTSYDECDRCGKGYLCQYGEGQQPFHEQYCPACEAYCYENDDEYVAGEKQFIEAVKNDDFEEMVRLDRAKREASKRKSAV